MKVYHQASLSKVFVAVLSKAKCQKQLYNISYPVTVYNFVKEHPTTPLKNPGISIQVAKLSAKYCYHRSDEEIITKDWIV